MSRFNPWITGKPTQKIPGRVYVEGEWINPPGVSLDPLSIDDRREAKVARTRAYRRINKDILNMKRRERRKLLAAVRNPKLLPVPRFLDVGSKA